MRGKVQSKYKRLTRHDRLVIERMLRLSKTKKEIAAALGVTTKTIYNEINRAMYKHKVSRGIFEMRYNPDAADEQARSLAKAKGREAILKEDSEFKSFVIEMITKKLMSPECILLYIKKHNLKFDKMVKSKTSIYDAIRKGYLPGVSMQDLPSPRKRKKHRVVREHKRAAAGTSIEKRPSHIDERDEYGHWEMDCVIGKRCNKKTLLVLTERKTRYVILERIFAKNAKEVVKAINRIEKRFGRFFYLIFKTITVDNGSEFMNFEGIQKSLYRKGDRTKVYYCHPYSSWERGTNERLNRQCRRILKKGSDFDKILCTNVTRKVQKWINSMPRKIFAGDSSLERFQKELEKIGCSMILDTS